MASRILLIGTARWAATLRRGHDVTHAPSGVRARAFSGQLFDLIVVDAASMYISGERICRDMRARFPAAALLLISAIDQAAVSAANLALSPPITARQLSGAIARLLAADPRDIIQCGPFLLNRTTLVLRAHGRQTQLNPKLASLIGHFLTNPNVTLLRAEIMRQVWKTAYLGDTRTLTVHIRQARKVLETDPQHPVYLKTVRGKGYRLDIATKKKSRQNLPGSVQ